MDSDVARFCRRFASLRKTGHWCTPWPIAFPASRNPPVPIQMQKASEWSAWSVWRRPRQPRRQAAAKPEPDADPVLPRRSRWRRAAGVVTEAWIFPALSVAFQALQGTAPAQLSDDALRATAGYPHLEDLGSRAKGWQTDDAPGSVEITWPRSASPHRRPFPFPPQADQQA